MSATVIFVLVAGALTLECWLARRNLSWLAAAGSEPARAMAIERARGRTRVQLTVVLVQGAVALAAVCGGAAAAVALVGPVFTLLGALVVRQVLDPPAEAWQALVLRCRGGQVSPALRDHARRIGHGLVSAAPATVVVAVGIPFAGPWWWLAVWTGWIAVALWREAKPVSSRRLRPLPPGPLSERLWQVRAMAGLHRVEVAVADESQRSNQLNARAEGIVGRRRIVLNDTLFTALEPELVAAVMAHEAGHLAGNHRRKFFAWQAGMSLAVLAAAAMLGRGTDPFVIVTLALLAAPVMALWVRPLETWLIRRWEYDADARAAAMVGAMSMATALERLLAANGTLLAPETLYAWFHSPHPPPAQRLARLRRHPNR